MTVKDLKRLKVSPYVIPGLLQGTITDRPVKSFSDITTMVCRYYDVPGDSYRVEKGRKDSFSIVRNIVVYLCRKFEITTNGELYKLIGYKDHSTLSSCHKTVDNERCMNKELDFALNIFENKIIYNK